MGKFDPESDDISTSVDEGEIITPKPFTEKRAATVAKHIAEKDDKPPRKNVAHSGTRVDSFFGCGWRGW